MDCRSTGFATMCLLRRHEHSVYVASTVRGQSLGLTLLSTASGAWPEVVGW